MDSEEILVMRSGYVLSLKTKEMDDRYLFILG